MNDKFMRLNNIFKLVIAIAVCEVAGIVGSLFTMTAIRSGWYAGLAKPELAPPNWIFGPVWTALFAMMGVAAWLIWRKLDPRIPSFAKSFGRAKREDDRKDGGDNRKVKIALIIFDIQLVLNVFWSIIFFGWRSPGGAFIEIIFLWIAIIAAIVAFAKISKPAAWLLIPYILWVSFAGYLNFAIWKLSSF